jgi:hypothetical protein
MISKFSGDFELFRFGRTVVPVAPRSVSSAEQLKTRCQCIKKKSLEESSATRFSKVLYINISDSGDRRKSAL